MPLRLLLIALIALSVPAVSKDDPFEGEFKGDEIRLVLKASGKDYRGTILFQGAKLPLIGHLSKEILSGKFVAGADAFPFEIKRAGIGLVLTTQGVKYRLEPVEKINPLARATGVDSSPPGAAGKDAGIVGNWRTPTGMMRFNADGTGVANGEAFRYQNDGASVTMTTPQTSVKLGYKVAGDVMTLSGPGGLLVCNRVVEGRESSPAMGSGRVTQELAGKWCYVANVNAVGGGARASNQCFTLQADGRYDYAGESDSYGPNGGATTQSVDRGTWTATDSTLTARSAGGRVVTYALQKRNHPKNNDPMLVLDGKAFVTFFNKPPWR